MMLIRALWSAPVVAVLGLSLAAGARNHRAHDLPYYSDETFTDASIAGRVAIVNSFNAPRCGDTCLVTRDRLRSVTARYANDDRVVMLSAQSGGENEVAPAERVLLVDRLGRVRGVYNGTRALEMENLRTDLDFLLAAQQER